MKNILTWICTGALLVGTSQTAFAAGGVATYNGTGATRGYTSSTGFVKERGDEDNHMGKDTTDQDKDKEDASQQSVEGDDKNEEMPKDKSLPQAAKPGTSPEIVPEKVEK